MDFDVKSCHGGCREKSLVIYMIVEKEYTCTSSYYYYATWQNNSTNCRNKLFNGAFNN